MGRVEVQAHLQPWADAFEASPGTGAPAVYLSPHSLLR